MDAIRQNQAKTKSQLHSAPVQAELFRQRPFSEPIKESESQPFSVQAQLERAARFGHDFGKVKVGGDAPAVVQQKAAQPKEEPEELEADFTAEPVKLMAPPVNLNSIQRQEEEFAPTQPLNPAIARMTLPARSSEPEECRPFPTLSPLSTPAIQREDEEEVTAPARSEQPILYNIRIQIPFYPPQPLENLTEERALRILRQACNHISGLVQIGQESHQELRQIHESQSIVSFISDVLGGAEMPSDRIWISARVFLDGALQTLEAGAVMPTARNLQRAADAWREANRALSAYREGTISGAETAQTTLEVVEVAGAVAATVATGGMASGGLLATSGAAALGAGAYGALSEEARQSGEMMQGMREEFDFGAILRRSATDAVTAFVGAFVGGALSRYMSRFFGSYLAGASDDLLRELGEQMGLQGPLPRDFFLTQGQRFIADFLGGIGSSPLTTATSTVLSRLSGARDRLPSVEEFSRQVFQEMVEGGIIQIFIGAIAHSRVSASAQAESTARSSSAPERTTATDSPESPGRRVSEEPARSSASEPSERLATNASEGLEATPDTIREGSVRMEEHPDYSATVAELDRLGFQLTPTSGDPHVSVTEVLNLAGEVIRVEKKVYVREGMRYLDLEHEVGHVRQLTERFGENPLPTDRVIEYPDGRVRNISRRGGVLTEWQNTITEYHNRLVEFLRLHERGANPELLREHAEGLREWRELYWDRGLKGGRSQSRRDWVQEHFPDLPALESRYNQAGGRVLE